MQEPDQRGRELIGIAAEQGLIVRALGGAAVRLVCPDATHEGPLRRDLNDLDLVTRGVDGPELERVLEECGLEAEKRFNLLHGDKRLLFVDPQTEKHLDVFVDRFEMCHNLDLRERLALYPLTLAPVDLLLTKLQIARITENDVRDVAALCVEVDDPLTSGWFDLGYLAQILGGDWGWWKTVTDNVSVVGDALGTIGLDDARVNIARTTLAGLRDAADDCPKSRRWKLRARLGTKIPWREEPEDPQR